MALRTAAAFVLFAGCALSQSPAYLAYQKGNALFAAKNFTEAKVAIDEALRLDPKLVSALTLRAKMSMAESNFELARESLERALSVDPKSEYAEFLYGLEAYVTNELQLALPRFEKARQLNPADPRAAFYAGLTLESLGQNERALAVYQEAIRLERKAGAPQAVTFLAAARLLALLGRDAESQSNLEEALKAEPYSRDAHFELARALLRSADAKAAAKEGEAALALAGGDTTDAQIHYLLLRAYQASGSTVDATRHAAALK